ncbi:hypothetical protein [Streptosporangium minutum]|uniref:Secreted protein n=1 Tax=Streptosporangium minutum TaxID=569862 RepID=A0A243R8E8_9ACTN|nr:hypothetical protein [Streptosporangium minutum]OUC90872.1 hypothetical protein CA984_35875 [Streptosporangium minutum]
MNHTFGRKAFWAALSAPILGLTLFGPATVEAGTSRTDGPCYVERFSVGRQPGARSVCPPQTWTHWHQVHVTCSFIAEVTEHGRMTGGTGVSEVMCPRNHILRSAWNTQGPDHP